MIDITPIVGAVIALVGTIITAVVIPYIRARTTAAQQEQLRAWVNVAVAAAEQLIKGNKMGAARKQSVLDFLRERGIEYDAEEVDAMIEAAVFEMGKSVVYTAELCSSDKECTSGAYNGDAE